MFSRRILCEHYYTRNCFKPKNSIPPAISNQWQIQDSPRTGANLQGGALAYYFRNFYREKVENSERMKEIGLDGGARKSVAPWI